MSRYYVCGLVDTACALICDRDDGVVEFVRNKIIHKYIKSGIDIRGVDLDGRPVSVIHDSEKLRDLKHKAIKGVLSGVDKVNILNVIASFTISVPDEVTLGFWNSTDIVSLVYKLGYHVDSSGDYTLVLSCYSIDSEDCCSDDEVILKGEDSYLPLVSEFLWKLFNYNRNTDDLKDLILKYFGGVENIIELTIMSGSYYLDCMKGDYHNILGIFNNGCLREEMYHL